MNPDISPPDGQSPADLGWATWERLTGGAERDPSLPRDDRCSMPGCTAVAVAAVRRHRSGSRPGFWQPYCAGHAHSRGVQLRAGDLVWTAEFRPTSDTHGAAPA